MIYSDTCARARSLFLNDFFSRWFEKQRGRRTSTTTAVFCQLIASHPLQARRATSTKRSLLNPGGKSMARENGSILFFIRIIRNRQLLLFFFPTIFGGFLISSGLGRNLFYANARAVGFRFGRPEGRGFFSLPPLMRINQHMHTDNTLSVNRTSAFIFHDNLTMISTCQLRFKHVLS